MQHRDPIGRMEVVVIRAGALILLVILVAKVILRELGL